MIRHRCSILSVLSVLLLVAASACASHKVKLWSKPANAQTHAVPVAPAPTTASVITATMAVETPADRYLSHIALLAHDELEGRDTGSDGIDLAAGYVAGQFAAAGLRPGGPGGTYFQEFTISRPATLDDKTDLIIEGPSLEPILKADFIPFGFSAKGDFAGDVVFVGYGVTNTDVEYDDYAGIEVTGRVVLMLRREPPGMGPYGNYTNHARFDSKVRLAHDTGAVAVLIANQDPGEDGIDGLMRFRVRDEDYGLPALHVKRRLADELLAAGGLPSLDQLQRQIDKERRNASTPLSGVRVSGTVAYKSNDLLARNVIGVLPGMGPRAGEYVVIGAHYDHVGVRRGRIYNGADDNASGTAGVIELARALSRTPYRDRSVICMTFSGEEIGLLGSQHFVDDPTVDHDSITAMINMDMIGRLTPDDEANMLAIHGLGTGNSFKEIVDRRAKEAGLDYLPDDSALGPSDHASFYRVGIPALFFHTGVHRDLHQPTDDTEKINAQGATRVVDLIYRIAMDLINGEDAPVFAEVHHRAKLFRGASPAASGVVMGIVPDMENESDKPGWPIAQVFPGGGAAKAGMKAGDRIVRIEGHPINDFADYREATAHKTPDDVIEVTVLREGKRITLSVELSARRRQR